MIRSTNRKKILLIILPLLLVLIAVLTFQGLGNSKPTLYPLSSEDSLAQALAQYGDYEIKEGNYDPKAPYVIELNKISSRDFPEKVSLVCDKLGDVEKQTCYSFSGAKLFLNNPSNPAGGLTFCDSLSHGEGKAGKNRTPANFCGSGLWGEFFNNLSTEAIFAALKPTAEQVISLCRNQDNFSNLTCYQEFGKYAMINKSTTSDSELYSICDSVKVSSYRDQCQSGAGRGISLKSSGNFLQLNVRCASLLVDDFTTKCFNSLGMDASSESFTKALEFCSSPLSTIGISCYYNYGKYAFGFNHGSVTHTIDNCRALATTNKDYETWCTLGLTNSIVHASMLYKDFSGVNDVSRFCKDAALIGTPIVQNCMSNFFMNLPIESIFTNTDSVSQFCKRDLQCYWSLGYSAKDEGLTIETFCPTAYLKFCNNGFQRKLF